MHKEDRLYKLSKGSDTAMWAHDEIVNQDNRIAELEKENLEIWAQFAKLQDVAEECALASTKVEAITILETFNDGFVESQALAIRDLEQKTTFAGKMLHEVANQYDGNDSTEWSIGANHVFALFTKWVSKALKEKG